MDILIRSVKIVDPGSSYNGKVKDILVENGMVTRIGDQIPSEPAYKGKVYDAKGQCISPGWFDMNVNFCDPGYETKEDIHSGIMSAIAGGFTGVACMPNTQPPLHSKSEIEYVMNKARGYAVDVHPFGTVSYNREGKDIAELYDMKQSGAVAFTDGNKPITDAGLMTRALQYAAGFGGLVISYAEDPSIANKAKVNEGTVSTRLGMKGIPALAEEIMISRDIALAEYTGSRIHFTTVSTAGSVRLIREARKKGLPVTADVSAYHLALDEHSLMEFDSHYKVKPPLRSESDVEALLQGLADGSLDVICSQHTPHEIEYKQVEFETAAYGMIGLETSFSLALEALQDKLGLAELIEKIAIRPRQILGLEIPSVSENKKANFTLFDTEKNWTLNADTIRSRSSNSPFTGRTFKGRATAVVNNGQFHLID